MNNLLTFLETRPNLRRLDQFDQAEVLRYRDWLRRERGDEEELLITNIGGNVSSISR